MSKENFQNTTIKGFDQLDKFIKKTDAQDGSNKVEVPTKTEGRKKPSWLHTPEAIAKRDNAIRASHERRKEARKEAEKELQSKKSRSANYRKNNHTKPVYIKKLVDVYGQAGAARRLSTPLVTYNQTVISCGLREDSIAGRYEEAAVNYWNTYMTDRPNVKPQLTTKSEQLAKHVEEKPKGDAFGKILSVMKPKQKVKDYTIGLRIECTEDVKDELLNLLNNINDTCYARVIDEE